MFLIDSNVLIDVLEDDPVWADWSANALSDAADAGIIAINPIIYGEVATVYIDHAALEAALAPLTFQRLDLPYEAAFLASRAFADYRRRGGLKRSPLPDFFIGAHAAVLGLTLVTRDPRPCRTYFQAVPVIAPPAA